LGLNGSGCCLSKTLDGAANLQHKAQYRENKNHFLQYYFTISGFLLNFVWFVVAINVSLRWDLFLWWCCFVFVVADRLFKGENKIFASYKKQAFAKINPERVTSL
jgi:hypothetical protein